MEKLIFRKLYNNITLFFIISIFSISLIIWITQAVNFLDLVSEDGHGLKIYFMYTLYSFPKIISRILLFIFFVSIFYVLIKYEEKNELLLFWINGIGKKEFARKIVKFSLIYLLLQLILSAIIVPYSNSKAKSFVRESKVNFLGSIINEQKFTDAVKDLTIFIGKKESNLLYDVFLKDRLGEEKFQIVSAKEGEIKNINNTNYLILYNGKIIDHDSGSINNFSFDKTQFNLSKYLTKTVLYPKIQEANLFDLSVKVNTDGKVVTEFNYIEKNTLVEALNEWKDDYPNTHILGAVVEYLKKVGHAVEEDVGKLCKS